MTSPIYVIQPERDEYRDEDPEVRKAEGTYYVPADDDADADIFAVYDDSGEDPELLDDFATRAEAEAAVAAAILRGRWK